MKSRKAASPWILYTAIAMFIGGWWSVAFLSPCDNEACGSLSPPYQKPNIPAPSYLTYLSTLDRDKIKEGLSGNKVLMAKLISDWDVDARILESHGVPDVKKLSHAKFIRAQMLARKASDREERGKESQSSIVDDKGASFDLTRPPKKFLPQTYVSAAILLALAPPESIVAIPRGFREETYFFPIELTSKIPLDIDRYNSEEIFQSKPDIAFVADYSQPATLQALKNQGIPLFTISSLNTLPEISKAINKVGKVVDRSQEAELLTLFMESALCAIDNHLLAMSRAALQEHGSPKILYLQHHSRLSMPTEKVISGQLVRRFSDQRFPFLTFPERQENEWQIPMAQEQLVSLDPDCLIVAASNGNALREMFISTPPFDSLKAVRGEHIHFIDLTPQAPTQYIVLAYYDIAEALVKTTAPKGWESPFLRRQ